MSSNIQNHEEICPKLPDSVIYNILRFVDSETIRQSCYFVDKQFLRILNDHGDRLWRNKLIETPFMACRFWVDRSGEIQRLLKHSQIGNQTNNMSITNSNCEFKQMVRLNCFKLIYEQRKQFHRNIKQTRNMLLPYSINRYVPSFKKGKSHKNSRNISTIALAFDFWTKCLFYSDPVEFKLRMCTVGQHPTDIPLPLSRTEFQKNPIDFIQVTQFWVICASKKGTVCIHHRLPPPTMIKNTDGPASSSYEKTPRYSEYLGQYLIPQPYKILYQNDEISAVTISDGRIALGSPSGKITLWDLQTGSQLRSYITSYGAVKILRLSGNVLWSIIGDATFAWRLNKAEDYPVRLIKHPEYKAGQGSDPIWLETRDIPGYTWVFIGYKDGWVTKTVFNRNLQVCNSIIRRPSCSKVDEELEQIVLREMLVLRYRSGLIRYLCSKTLDEYAAFMDSNLSSLQSTSFVSSTNIVVAARAKTIASDYTASIWIFDLTPPFSHSASYWIYCREIFRNALSDIQKRLDLLLEWTSEEAIKKLEDISATEISHKRTLKQANEDIENYQSHSKKNKTEDQVPRKIDPLKNIQRTNKAKAKKKGVTIFNECVEIYFAVLSKTLLTSVLQLGPATFKKRSPLTLTDGYLKYDVVREKVENSLLQETLDGLQFQGFRDINWLKHDLLQPGYVLYDDIERLGIMVKTGKTSTPKQAFNSAIRRDSSSNPDSSVIMFREFRSRALLFGYKRLIKWLSLEENAVSEIYNSENNYSLTATTGDRDHSIVGLWWRISNSIDDV